MAGTAGRATTDLIEEICLHGHRFSFIQVLRLLHAAGAASGAGGARDDVVVRSQLSLAFPAADVATVHRLPDEVARYLVEVSFLGLYGASSPLPNFYTEQLMEEGASDVAVNRDFLDMLQRRCYELYFESWRKYRLWHEVGASDAAALERLLALCGVGTPELQGSLKHLEPQELVHYLGLFAKAPRCALGLETLLRDASGGCPVQVVQCVRRQVKLPVEERLRLGSAGCTLGESAVIGEEIVDLTGKFRVTIGPVAAETFERLLPGEPLQVRLAALIDCYLIDPLVYDFEVLLDPHEVTTLRLGEKKSARLGLTSWCFSQTFAAEARLRIPCTG